MLQTTKATGIEDIDQTIVPTDHARDWRLVYVRCHFIDKTSTAAITDADLAITIKSRPHDDDGEQAHDLKLNTLPGVGLTRDADYQPCERDRPIMPAGYGLGIAWTNPNAGLIAWGLEVAYEYMGEPTSLSPGAGRASEINRLSNPAIALVAQPSRDQQ